MKKLNLSFGLTSNTGNFNLSSKINKFFYLDLMQMNLKISNYHKKQHDKIYRSTELF